MSLEVIITADGSPSLLNKQLNATYHSKHGAVNESMHVFIKHGLIPMIHQFENNIRVLEIGFGSGLNAFLTALEGEKLDKNIDYTAVEKFPIDNYIFNLLAFEKIFNTDEMSAIQKIHNAPWGKRVNISERFNVCKYHAALEELAFTDNFHLIYFDAFAPEVCPELWQDQIFQDLKNVMLTGAALVTFCAKGSVKRMLRTVGFDVQTLPGAPGKREMTRAVKL